MSKMDEGTDDLIALSRKHYDKALRGARIRRIRDKLTGHDSRLIPFSNLQHIVEFSHQHYHGLQAVPIARIIGSLDRSRDFDRLFEPTQKHSQSKWLSIDRAWLLGIYLPPIKLYQVGDAYFVVDGHHRVSVARQQGQAYIDAEVIEVESRVPVTADLTMDDLDLLGPFSDFIKATKLDVLRPDGVIRASRPDSYQRLLEHIQVHKYFIDQNRSQPSSWEEAVTDWYDNIYMPFVKAIRKYHLQRDFDQTETDLYLWIIDHAYFLTKRYQHNITPDQAALDFVSRFSRRPQRVLARLWINLRDKLTLRPLKAGPPAGMWRTERVNQDQPASLFRDILVTISGAESGWLALSQAGEIARRENGTLHGLHVIASDTPQLRSQGEAILQEFVFRCQSMGLPYTTSLEVGDIEQKIIERARWSDLVVINQRKVHGQWAEVPLGSIFHGVAEKSARPILAVPGTTVRTPQKLLLAYDGSPKSREALFVMRNLVARWQVEGIILTVESPHTSQEMLDGAWQYVSQSAKTVVVSRFEAGQPQRVILNLMKEENASMLLMGGYGYTPLLKAFLGSTVDLVLREAWFPVLICR